MSSGAMYLNHRQSAAEHRLLAHYAAEDECSRQRAVATDAAAHHEERAAAIRSQLHAARKLGLRGSAGHLPKNYFASA